MKVLNLEIRVIPELSYPYIESMTRLMNTCNICFYGEITKIILELSPNTPT